MCVAFLLTAPFLVALVVTFLLIVPFLVVLYTLSSCLSPLDQVSITAAALTFKVADLSESYPQNAWECLSRDNKEQNSAHVLEVIYRTERFLLENSKSLFVPNELSFENSHSSEQ